MSMKVSSVSVLAFSFLILPAVSAEAGESAGTDAGIRSEVSAVSRSSEGNASSSVSSMIRSSDGGTVVESEAVVESDGERIEIREVSEGGDIDIRKESDSGSVAVSVSTDVGAAEGFSEKIAHIETEMATDASDGERGTTGWWTDVTDWILGWFR